MANYQEGERDPSVETNHCAPHEVLEHSVIFILPHAVVGVKVDVTLSKTVHLEEMMQQTENGVGSLPCVSRLINQVCNLSKKSLTTDPK